MLQIFAGEQLLNLIGHSSQPSLSWTFFLDFVFNFFHLNTLTVNVLCANPTKRSSTQQFVDKLQTKCLIVFDHFVGLALKSLVLSQPCKLMSAHIVLVGEK